MYSLVAGGGKGARPLQAKAVAAGDAGYALSEVRDNNGNIDIGAQGPNHSLLAYWLIGTHWNGPIAVNGPGTTFSAPSILIDASNNLDLAVQGPGNSLWVYWNIGGTWNGPLGIGGSGIAFSSPVTTLESDGTVDVAVQGPSNSLMNFWEVNAHWFGPFGVGGPGTTFSPPSIASSIVSGVNVLRIVAEGPNSESRTYEADDGTWLPPNISGVHGFQLSGAALLTTDIAAPSRVYVRWFEGPGNTMLVDPSGVQDDGESLCVIDQPGDAFSAPALDPTSGTLAYMGPNNSLRFLWYNGPPSPQVNQVCGSLQNPSGPLDPCPNNCIPWGDALAFSVPSIVTDGNGHPYVVFEGPFNSLYGFYALGGNWVGPIGIGGQGSTFSSPN